MSKKGQTATEFLINYGWSVLIILIAIGILVYFGLFTSNSEYNSRCIILGINGLSCKSSVSSEGINLVLENNAGIDLNELVVNVGSCNPSKPGNLVNKGILNINLNGCGVLIKGSSFEGSVKISYKVDGELVVKHGELVGIVR